MMSNSLTELLKREGFNQRKTEFDSIEYCKRIHDLIWLIIDEHGFVTFERKSENKQQIHKVTIPKHLKNEQDYFNLITAII